MERVKQQPEVTEETVELAYGDDIESPLLSVGEEPFQGRPIIDTSAVTSVDVFYSSTISQSCIFTLAFRAATWASIETPSTACS